MRTDLDIGLFPYIVPLTKIFKKRDLIICMYDINKVRLYENNDRILAIRDVSWLDGLVYRKINNVWCRFDFVENLIDRNNDTDIIVYYENDKLSYIDNQAYTPDPISLKQKYIKCITSKIIDNNVLWLTHHPKEIVNWIDQLSDELVKLTNK